jgi:hypothetical protein
LVFNPIKRIADNDHNDFVAGGDYQVIQSNVSLLNYAAKETQDRLLKIERAIFGIDAPTLPGTQEIDNYVRNKLYSYSESLNDMGIIRIIKELFNNKILEDTLYDNGEVAGTISYFNDVYLELFGNYENEDEWNTISGSLYNTNGKLHQVYLTYKDILIWQISGIYNIFNEDNPINDMEINERIPRGLETSRNIYLYKTQFGYQFEDENSPFRWPITLDNWNGPEPKTRWWESQVMGHLI